MMDIMNGRFAKYAGGGPQVWMFFLALFSPAALCFSYAFMIEWFYRYWLTIFWIHIGFVVVSVLFCSIWTATQDLREKLRAGPLVLGLLFYPVFQVALHMMVCLFGWFPIIHLTGQLK